MKTKVIKTIGIISIPVLLVLVLSFSSCSSSHIRAGAAQCDITPPVGYEITHFFRYSTGVHDPLFARCLYLEDNKSNSVAIICLDLNMGDFQACDELRKEIREKTGIDNSLINFSHSHSSEALGPRGHTTISNDTSSRWNDRTLDAIIAIVKQARERAEPVLLRAGRAPAQVGFNRRLINKETGHIYMGDNQEGPVVPWVNVLVADSRRSGKPIAVLFEHAAHPVIVPSSSNLTSADYPGAAVKRVREVLGDDVIALFGQGCCGNINGFPIRSTHEKADQAGRDLGNAVLKAIENSDPINSNTFSVKFAQVMLPSAPFPSEEEWGKMFAENTADLEKKVPYDINQWGKEYSYSDDGRSIFERRLEQLKIIRDLRVRSEEPPPRRFDAYAVMIGKEWCLVTMPHEMFCDYELWIDKNAPFKHNMTFAYTNGYDGYIAVDEAWRMGAKGGYEAATLPNWEGQVWNPHCGPPAVGCEKIIKDDIASLWVK